MREIASLGRFDLFDCMVSNRHVVINGEQYLIRSIAKEGYGEHCFNVTAENVASYKKKISVRINTLTRTCGIL